MKSHLATLALAGLFFSGCAETAPSTATPQKNPAPAPMGIPKANAVPMPGGFSDAVLTDEGAIAAAKAVAAKIGGGWSFSELVSARSQVVAGINYELVGNFAKGGESRRASATVWRKLDGSLEVTAWKWEQPAEQVKKAPLPGGFSPLAVTDAGVLAAAKAAVAAKGEGWSLEQVVAAESQVVAGTNYELTLGLAKGGQKEKATTTVWRKLDGTFQVTAWKVQKPSEKPPVAKPRKPGVPGGFSKLPATDAGAIAAAKAVQAKIGGGWTYDGLLSAQSQVVAGTNYKLVARFAQGAEKKKASATVWRKLDGTLEVTAWKWL